MKIKLCHVTNSSSTAFFITNKTDELKTLVDFVNENPQLIKQFVSEYDWYQEEKYNQENLINSALQNNINFPPQEEKYCVFGDEDGTLIGHVFDYILRDGGDSESFSWRFEEYLR